MENETQVKSYIEISNDGELSPDGVFYLGVSTKRNDDTKIGEYGSGIKWSIPVLIRSGIEFKIYAGLNEITIDMIPKTILEEETHVIVINGKESSITAGWSKDWKEWQVIREFYSNALDEEGCLLNTVNTMQPEVGKTKIYIENTGQYKEIMSKFDMYFSTRKPGLIHIDKHVEIYEKQFEKTSFYRRGIRCVNDNYDSLYDWNFFNVSFYGEDRLVSRGSIETEIRDYYMKRASGDMIEELITKFQVDCNQDNFEYYGFASYYTYFNNNTWQPILDKHLIAPINLKVWFADRDDITYLPSQLYDALKNSGLKIKIPVGLGGKVNYKIIDSPFSKNIIDKAMEFFVDCSYQINAPIVCATFEKKETLSYFEDDKIILSDQIVSTEVAIRSILSANMIILAKDGYRSERYETTFAKEFLKYMAKVNNIPL